MKRIGPLFWISSLLLFSIVAVAEDDKVPKADPNIAILNEMLGNMDESVDPCQNFQNYSVKYIKPVKLPTIIPEFISLFEELNNQIFEEGSLEWKTQRVYNICLASRSGDIEPEQVLTVEELENWFQISLSKFLNYYYGRFISPSSVVHIKYRKNMFRFIRLLRTFNASDWTRKNKIESVFEIALRLPDIQVTQNCVEFVAARMGLAVNLLYEERFLGPENLSQLQSKVQKKSQLSFMRLAQTSTQHFGFQTELFNNLLPRQPSFLQAFNCKKNNKGH